jgi:2-haloacid dehalogenase
LLDSRAGGSATFDRLAGRRGWVVDGTSLYDRWDTLNKEAQRTCRDWVPFAELSARALAAAYDELGLDGDPEADAREVLGSVGTWPLWPDVADQLPRFRDRYRVGLLSNVDDDVFERTQAAPLVDRDVALTSQRLQAYKPSPLIYQRAVETLTPMAHVATSARDVRGALEAGIPVVRLVRPGHRLDPAGPEPPVTVHGLAELDAVLPQVLPSG